MLKKALLMLLVAVLSIGIVFAYAPKKSNSLKDRAPTPARVIDVADYPQPEGLNPVYYPWDTDDPIGEVIMLGTTWYDIQHNGTCGHQLNLDSEGYVHLAWMNGLNSGASQRHVYYQLMSNQDSLYWTAGVQVDQLPRAGYCVEVLYPDNRAMPLFHQGQGGTANNHTAIAYDFFPRTGAFQTVELPWVYEFGLDIEVIWPRASIGLNNRIQILSTENPASGVAGDPQRIYYGWAEYNPTTFTMTTCTAQAMISWTEVIASDIATSPVSNRACIGYMKMCATNPNDTTQYDNELMLIFSDDGLNWDFRDTINVTHWIPVDSSYLVHNDTLRADQDTLRCYTDMCLMFDYNDVLHAFFSTRGYYDLEGTLTWGNGYIWHWSEDDEVFSMVANGWYENGFYDPGAWNIYVNRPSAAVDPETGYIYCMYQRYFNFGTETTFCTYSDTLPFPYLHGDTTYDWSAAGWPCGEIWVSKSVDNGYYWSEGINITNTHSLNAAPNDCSSELTPSVALQIQNDKFHIFYIEDRDAGAVVQTEGTWTLNEAIYHRVDLADIPIEPVLPPFPMHCDSSQMPTEPWQKVVADDGGFCPDNFTLEQNYPNPFNAQTSIKYSLSTDGFASLIVYNIKGEVVATIFQGNQKAGGYTLNFDASNLSSGIYFYRLEAQGFTHTAKMVLMK